MPSIYLQSADYAAFGVPSATAAQITQASTLIDAYLMRPSGLLFASDSNGNPAYMSALTAGSALITTASCGPGTVNVHVTGPMNMMQVGDCAVIDRNVAVEAVQITAMDTTAKTISFVSQFAHASGATVEFGLLLTEQRYLPKNRSEVTLANSPVAAVIGGTGRYSYGRRSEGAGFNMDNFNLLASLSKFGGPPAWEIWPANSPAGIDSRTGRVWVPSGIMLAYYSEVKIRYISGFQYSNLPPEIKMACAQIILTMANDPVMGGVKSLKAGDTAVTKFAATVLSDDVKNMLQPLRSNPFA